MKSILEHEPALSIPGSVGTGRGAEFSADIFRLLELLPLPCRIVTAERKVIWETSALRKMLPSTGGSCCESLSIQHHDADCVSLRTIRTGRAHRRDCWLGQIYVSIETVPLSGFMGAQQASFEFFNDITVEKRLESAFIQQQELLEATNKAMIEINHHLEAAQCELEAKNQSLEGANDRLRSLDKMKDEFISIVSHELKAPLTSIKGSVELIQACEQDKLSPDGLELLSICRRNTDRLHGLVKDLLDIARIESGRLSLGFRRFAVSNAVEECFQSVRTLADQKSLTLESIVAPGLEMEADYDRMVQVLINLVNNAVKFTDQGSIAVECTALPSKVILNVRDTGIGIPVEAHHTIFEKFGQVGSTLHRNSTGTGLGLSIVRGIVHEHGGEISVRSEPGQGSCFTFTIPQPPGKVNTDVTGPLD